MMRILGFCSVVFCTIVAYATTAQSVHEGFNKTYDFGQLVQFRSIVSDSTNLYVTGIYRDSPLAFQSVALYAMDTLGSLKWSYIISDDSSAISTALEPTTLLTSQGIIVMTYTYLNRPSIGMSAFAKTGDLVWQREYPEENETVIVFEIAELDNGFIMSGVIQDSNFNVDMFLYKLDQQGEVIWSNRYGAPDRLESPRSISVLNSNRYLIAGVSQNDVNNNTDPNEVLAWATTIDSNGVQTWEWQADISETPRHGILSLYRNVHKNEFVYLSTLSRKTNYPGEDFTVFVPIIVRRDSAMNLIDYTEYGPYAISHYLGRLIENDGDLIGVGRTTKTGDDFVSPVASEHGRVIRVSDEGLLKWSVMDTAFFDDILGSKGHLSGVTATHTGSVYACGWADGEGALGQRSFGWLLKITKDGCLDSCITTATTDLVPDIVSVYPNPASDQIVFEIDRYEKYNRIIHIFNVNGQPIYGRTLLNNDSKLKVNTTTWASGMYIWTVTDELGRGLSHGKIIVSR